MADNTYRTKQGEMVDEIAWKQYGHQDGTAEAVIDANPGLAALGPILPLGTVIVLPTIEAPSPENSLVRLWD